MSLAAIANRKYAYLQGNLNSFQWKKYKKVKGQITTGVFEEKFKTLEVVSQENIYSYGQNKFVGNHWLKKNNTNWCYQNEFHREGRDRSQRHQCSEKPNNFTFPIITINFKECEEP